MFRKSMLALAAVTAIFGAAALTSTDASAGGGKGWHGKGGGWHGKHFGHGHRFGHGFYGYGYGDCGYILTRRGFMKYVCY